MVRDARDGDQRRPPAGRKRLRTQGRERKAGVRGGGVANALDGPRRAARRGAATTCVTYAGWFVRPRCGTGARYGLSVSASSRSAGTARAAACRSVGRLERDDAAEAQERAEVEAAPRLVGAAGEAVEDGALRHALGARARRTCRPTRRGCGSPAAARARGRAGSARRTRRAARRAASGRSSSRARTRRRRSTCGSSRNATIVSTPCRASCGCRPAGGVDAVVAPRRCAIAARVVAASQPTLTIVVDAGGARPRR